ncbi:hypothetical protein [Lysinibacillus contaminans]|uniref:hypothetical protein n=1 Tax=Lysinibacillus contaminans TaxID=1293441 RepID=UPI000B1B9322|nr:hypothetical protein [Lysinibacillus contaminans]
MDGTISRRWYVLFGWLPLLLLQAYRQQLSTLEREIDQLMAQLEEYELIQSLPGVGRIAR